MRLYPSRKRRQIRSTSGQYFSGSPCRNRRRQETGSSAAAPDSAAEDPGRRRPVAGMHHPQVLHAQPLLAAHGSISGRRWYGRMKANRPCRGKKPGRRREELRKRAGHLVPRRLLPRIRVSTPVPARPYGGFDTTRSNEPGTTPGISPRKSPPTAEQRPSGQLSRKFSRAKSSRSSWSSTPVPETIPGERRDRRSSRTPHPVPRSRTAPRQ